MFNLDFYNENCNQNCRTEPNYYKAAKLFLGGKGGSNAVGSIQLMEDDTLVIKPIDVATVFNEYYVNVTSSIGPPTEAMSHMSDVEFVQHSVHKYKNHSSIQHINKLITNSQHPNLLHFRKSVSTQSKKY